MLNLITNAAQAMEKIKPEDRGISITGTSGDGYVTVAVRDCGEGIDEVIMGKLFKPFATSREGGLGIGLAISHAIISEHQGKIHGKNIPNGGAEFSFSLKVIHDES
jgi:C4-dicarboxylate-specific signal transduction histidine kinase